MKRGPDWLLEALPDMQAQGVVDAETAARLRTYCARHTSPQRPWARLLLGVLGAGLVGFGVVLLIAHNWEALPRMTRIIIAFAPLLIGQLACLWAVTGAAQARLWREGAGAFTALAFAAALALVGQIYHLSGDLDRFLLTCGLVSLPMAYLLRAQSVLLLCAAAFLGWTAAAGDAPPLAVAAAFAALLPLIAWERQTGERLTWQLALAVWMPVAVFAVATSMAAAEARAPALMWLALWSAIAWLLRDPDAQAPVGPVHALGQGGLVLLAAWATFHGFWDAGAGVVTTTAPYQIGSLMAVGLAGFLVLLGHAVRARNWFAAAATVPVAFVAMALLVDLPDWGQILGMVLANAYALAMGLYLLHRGLQQNRVRLAHAGLVAVAALVVIRFLDAAVPFTVRGIAFVAVGIAFMLASAWLRRRAVQA